MKTSTVTFSTLLLFSCVMLLNGCNSSPTSSSTNNIVGVWLGTSTLATVSPTGTPVAQLLVSSVGQIKQISANIASPSQTTCRVTYTSDGQYDDYSGTFSGSTFSLTGTYSSSAIITGVNAGGVLYDIHLNTEVFSGTISGNNITGTIGASYNIVYSSNGAAAGIITTSETISLHR